MTRVDSITTVYCVGRYKVCWPPGARCTELRGFCRETQHINWLDLSKGVVHLGFRYFGFLRFPAGRENRSDPEEWRDPSEMSTLVSPERRNERSLSSEPAALLAISSRNPLRLVGALPLRRCQGKSAE